MVLDTVAVDFVLFNFWLLLFAAVLFDCCLFVYCALYFVFDALVDVVVSLFAVCVGCYVNWFM